MSGGLHLLMILAVTALFFAVVIAPILGRILGEPRLGVPPCAPCGSAGMSAPRFHTDLFPPSATARDRSGVALSRMRPKQASHGQAASWDTPDDEGETDRMIDIGRVEGRLRAGAVGKINQLIDRHPQAAAAVVRNWLRRDE